MQYRPALPVLPQTENDRRIEFIVLHTTATPETSDVSYVLRVFERREWSRPGYHVCIDRQGLAHRLWPDDSYTNGAIDRRGRPPIPSLNAKSIHVSWIGGIDTKARGIDNRTPEQLVALREVTLAYAYAYPNALLAGHYAFANKECPCFDYPGWLRHIGLPADRIFDRGVTPPVASILPPKPF